MNFLFLMDPPEAIIPYKDTSLALMRGAMRKGHTVYYLPLGGITLNQGRATFEVEKLKVSEDNETPLIQEAFLKLSEQDVDVIFVRTDPPFDEDYLNHTWLLERLDPRIRIVNNPVGIRTVNEKIWATQFVDIVPPTLITRNKDEFFEFFKQFEQVVVKPTNSYGGMGIFLLNKNDSNASVAFEMISDYGMEDVLVQMFVPASKQGDKRILLLNGEPLGAVLRVHPEGEHRNNFFAGGKPVATEMTARDHEIIQTLKPHLQKLGLYFVGIDVIGDYLIEVNVTSPTCLQEMNRLDNVSLEDKVIDFCVKMPPS